MGKITLVLVEFIYIITMLVELTILNSNYSNNIVMNKGIV
jgi:hypothetical protein